MVFSFRESTIDSLAFIDNFPAEQVAEMISPLQSGRAAL